MKTPQDFVRIIEITFPIEKIQEFDSFKYFPNMILRFTSDVKTL